MTTTDNPMPCPKCGQPHPRCSAHTRAGKPCGQPPLTGQRVCKMHGGKAGHSLAAAQRRVVAERAREAAASFGLPVAVDPSAALLAELYRTVGAVEWLGAIVGDLDQADITWGRTEQVQKTSGEFPGTDTTFAAAPNVWVELWQKERDHLVKVSAACLRAGIEERRVRLAEAQGAVLAQVARTILDGMRAGLLAALDTHGVRVLEQAWPSLVERVVPDAFRQAAIEGTPSGPAA